MKELRRAALLGTLALTSACVVREQSQAPKPPPPVYQQPPPPPLTPAAIITVSPTEAATSLAEAQCNHEAKCNRIGPTARYADWTHCLNIAAQAANDKFAACGRGVRQTELTTCLSEITGQGCGLISEPIDSVESFYACRTAGLCY